MRLQAIYERLKALVPQGVQSLLSKTISALVTLVALSITFILAITVVRGLLWVVENYYVWLVRWLG